MRRPVLVLALVAGLLTACSDDGDGAASSTPPSAAPTSAAATPSAAPPAAGPTPSLSRTQQEQALTRIYGRLSPDAQQQFCAQSDAQGPAALAEALTQQGASQLDADVLEEFLVDTCGKG